MPGERFAHIYLSGPASSPEFTSVQSGGGKARVPGRDRVEHAKRVASRLEDAWKKAGERQAAAHSDRHGHYLEFVSATGFDLALQSLEARRSGIRLLNVRVVGEGDGAKTYATVYVPANKSGHFLAKVRCYETEQTEKGNPKNGPLVNSIDDVRDALLQAFWTDGRKPLPSSSPEWIEVWLSSDSNDAIQRFRETCSKLRIKEHDHRPLIKFPERSVLLIQANRQQLASLIESSDDIAEFRGARETVSFFIQLENKDQGEWAENLKRRITLDGDRNVSVCILDHGVNNGHPILEGILASTDLRAAHSEWGTSDDDGHGTLMAGLAAFGDLQGHLESDRAVRISHVLESVKMLPPPPEKNPKHLWGHVTARAISEAEVAAPERKRILCMAITAEDEHERGKPSSWSAEIDALTSGADDEKKRLIIVSGGNVRDSADWRDYPTSNVTKEIEDPGQAWNALTVGGCTFKTRIDDPTLAGYSAIAAAGGLSPYSRTSITWQHSDWPIKPEVVFEAANIAWSGEGVPIDADDLQILSTCSDVTAAHFERFHGTSAATAQAAWMAAQIQCRYPEAWPETIRALLVHSADWTKAMVDGFLHGTGKGAYKKLLRTCGYGIPDLERALFCMKNSLTLVAQSTLQPFQKREGRYATKDMHLYRLPWPQSELLKMGETPVKMRVTLSYLIEPGPGEIGWKDRYRYASYGLRFELNSPGEDEQDFQRRINKQTRTEEEGEPITDSPNDHWTLGQQRNVGSIHSDIWTGRAADLATSRLIAVRPSIGWWRERAYLGKWGKTCRYALVVSVETPSEEIDIYTPVAVQVGIATPVPIEIRI